MTNPQIEVLEAPWSGWDALVAPLGASLWHRGFWLELWRRHFGQRGVGLVARADGVAIAALPLVRKRRLPMGHTWVSMPYFDTAGLIGAPSAAPALLAAAADLAGPREVVEVRMAAAQPWPWTASTGKHHVVLALPDSVDALYAGFKPKLRSQVRRAEREPIEVRIGGRERVADFHDVYSRRMRELGSPAHAPALFHDIVAGLPAEAAIVTVHLHDRCGAAALLLRDGERVSIPWASSLLELNPVGINMLLYARCLQWAVEQHARSFDFGRSDAGSGQMKFKLQWGGEERVLHWYRSRAAAEGREHEAPAWPLQVASDLWKRLPLGLTRALGPRIVRYF